MKLCTRSFLLNTFTSHGPETTNWVRSSPHRSRSDQKHAGKTALPNPHRRAARFHSPHWVGNSYFWQNDAETWVLSNSEIIILSSLYLIYKKGRSNQKFWAQLTQKKENAYEHSSEHYLSVCQSTLSTVSFHNIPSMETSFICVFWIPADVAVRQLGGSFPSLLDTPDPVSARDTYSAKCLLCG